MLTWKMACASTASPYVMRDSKEIFIVMFMELTGAYWELSVFLCGNSPIIRLLSPLHIYIPSRKPCLEHT